MLNDLRKYDCLGTPNYFFELLTTIQKNEIEWHRKDLDKLFYNKIIDNRPLIDGGIELGLRIKVLNNENQLIKLNSEFENCLNSVKQMTDRFNLFLFEALKNDDTFLSIFSSKHLSYDIIYRTLQINNAAFGFKFSNFKQLLIDFNAIQKHPTVQFNSFIINSRYKKIFDKSVLPEIKKRKIGIEELKKSIEQQQIYGEEAERFVLKFESKRLNSQKEIGWVAEYVANEGYDIASYNTIEDKIPNRFIEVKSFEGTKPYFFWSRNEFQVARQKKDQYWIYLVNRTEINNVNYIPIMVQNPHENILNNDKWVKEIDKYKIIAN